MAATIVLTSAAGTNAPYKLGSPPDFGTLYSGRALEFDGVVDYVAFPIISFTGAFTISAWLYPDDISNVTLIGDDLGTSYHVFISATVVRFRTQDDLTDPWTHGLTFTTGEWQHLAIVRNSSNVITIYRNGVAGGTTETQSGIFAPQWIGTDDDYNYFWNGKMANLQLWDAAWSASDVQYAYTHPEKLASDTPATSLTTSNLKAWYPMTEGNPRSPQTTVYDGSGEGNHGTTTFLGDDLWDTAAATGTVVDNWVVFGNNTVAVDTNRVKITYVDNAQGAKVLLSDALDLSSDLVVGRSYRITVDASFTGGSSGTILRVSANHGGAIATTSAITGSVVNYTLDFVAVSVDGDHFQLASMASSNIVFLDNFTIKEIGVAASWTTADAEPLIPQTALMGMSKPMVFDGYDDYVNIDGVVTDVASDTNGTISAWIVSNEDNSGDARIIGFGDTNAAEYIYLGIINGLLTAKVKTAGGGDRWVLDTDATFDDASALNHVVLTQDGTEPVLYINGAKPAQAFYVSTDKTEWFTDASGIDNGRIGCYNHTTGVNRLFMKGVINEVSVWNTAFDIGDVQELFNDGVPLAATAHDKEPNLKGYWRNDGISSWADRQDNVTANNGTPAGSPVTALIPEGTTAGKDILGFPLTHPNNGWLNLDGSEYVECPDNDTLSFGGSTGDKAFSIEAWIKMDDATSFQIVSKGVYNTDAEFKLEVFSDDKMYLYLYDESAANTYESAYTNSTLTAHEGSWIHIAATYNGIGGTSASGGIKMYINAVRQALTANDLNTYTAMENLAGSVWIGGWIGTTPTYAKGSIDEVKIYNRVLTALKSDGSDAEEGDTLTSGEIYKNYLHGKSKHS